MPANQPSTSYTPACKTVNNNNNGAFQRYADPTEPETCEC